MDWASVMAQCLECSTLSYKILSSITTRSKPHSENELRLWSLAAPTNPNKPRA